MDHGSSGTTRARVLILLVTACAPMFAPALEKEPRRYESTGEIRAGGDLIRYRAVVEETFLRNDEGEPTASLISTSYIRIDVDPGTSRPVIFVFNGGPGSAGLWMQMGLFGPRRVDFEDAVRPPTVPPFQLTDNTESPLDVADIVIFDPPGTGLSRVTPAGKPEEFFGVEQDAQVTVDFVHSWVQRYGRWNSPRFLAGESYGSIRAAVTANLMVGGPFGTGGMEGLTLNGVILLGQALGREQGIVAHVNNLPSFAATAWYHGKVETEGRKFEQHIADARVFAGTEYLSALYAGARLDEGRSQEIARQLAKLVGLPAEQILENGLAITADQYSRMLLASDGLQVGKYDSRFVLPLKGSGDDPVADDPAMGQYVPAFVAALNMHLREELGVDMEESYLPIEFREVNSRWDYGQGPGVQSRGNHAQKLATAMRRNPALNLFVGTGHYDLVTTVGAAEYIVAHSDFPPDRVTLRNYESGHMPYLGDESRKRLADDLRDFIVRASRPSSLAR